MNNSFLFYIVNKSLKYFFYLLQMQKLDSMSEVEGVEGIEYKNNPLNVFSSYNFGLRTSRKELPIDAFKNKVFS